MKPLPFSAYCFAYPKHTAIVIGKGPTLYEYERLAKDSKGKIVLFINDAVQLESYIFALKNGPAASFQFFLDQHQAGHWLTAPVESVRVAKLEQMELARSKDAAVWYKDVTTFPMMTRKELSGVGVLWRYDAAGGGTICPLLHWCWYIGISKVQFIGCDGINRKDIVRSLTGGADYDQRLNLAAGGQCGWKNDQIRRNQNMLCELFGFETEYIGTPPMPERKPIKYVSAATPSYADLLGRLKESAKAVGIDLYTEYIADTGKWEHNCAAKPFFLAKLQQVWPHQRLVWVDADAEFKAKPTLFDELPESVDLAFARRGQELLSGTVYIGDGQGGQEIVARWCQEQRRNLDIWDQKTLQKAIQTAHPMVQYLPPSYTFIDGITAKENPGVEPVIYHHQASRERK